MSWDDIESGGGVRMIGESESECSNRLDCDSAWQRIGREHISMRFKMIKLEFFDHNPNYSVIARTVRDIRG